MRVINKKSIPILLGNALEYYDFMLYGFFATILAPLFFPSDIPAVSLIVSMGSYGVGFLARPLGGIFFGHLGDRWGRKDTLSLSILLVTLPTLGIGLLPTYEQIGFWAPVLLVLCRLIQGFCLGGESNGAMTYIIENVNSEEKDKASAWLVLSCYVGTLIGTLLGALFTSSLMPSWGWRLTFVMGSLIAFIGYYIRRQLKESPEFLESQKQKKIRRFPIKELFKNQKMNLFYAAALASAVVIPFFIIFIYLNGMYVKHLSFEPSIVLALNAGLMCFWIALLPLAGFLAQQYSRKTIMTWSVLSLAFLSYPLFAFIDLEPSFMSILLAQIMLSICAIAYAAPTSAFLVDLFPVTERYSGIGFGYSLGHAIFGGLTPLILTTLVQSLDFQQAPVVFLIMSSLLGFIPLQRGIGVKKSSPTFKLEKGIA